VGMGTMSFPSGIPISASGAIAAAGISGNATALTVPAAPSVAGGGGGAGTTGVEGPREAGTSAPAVVGTSGGGRVKMGMGVLAGVVAVGVMGRVW